MKSFLYYVVAVTVFILLFFLGLVGAIPKVISEGIEQVFELGLTAMSRFEGWCFNYNEKYNWHNDHWVAKSNPKYLGGDKEQ